MFRFKWFADDESITALCDATGAKPFVECSEDRASSYCGRSTGSLVYLTQLAYLEAGMTDGLRGITRSMFHPLVSERSVR
jgi:hypothetical protein